MDTHLVFDGATAHAIALAGSAIGVGQELRHDKQRNAFGASRRIGQTRQHDVHDVAGHVVFAGRDEDLGTAHFVAAVGLRFGLGAQHAQVGAAVRFGQAHGAGPLTGYQLGQVGLLLLGCAVLGDGVHGAVGQAGVHAPGPVRLTDHFADRQAQGFRQALATVIDVVGQAWPAAFDELLVGFLETSRGLNAGLAPGAAFEIAHAVQRSQYLLTKLGAFLKNGVNHVRSCVGTSRKALIVRFVAEQLVTNEANITQGGLVVRHSDKPLLMNPGWSDRNRSASICRLIKQLFETYVYAETLSSVARARCVEDSRKARCRGRTTTVQRFAEYRKISSRRGTMSASGGAQ
ncbi:hypothetical protein D3C80_825740 [compost metagenome]